MPTVPTHALVATTLFACWWQRAWSWKLLAAGVVCAMLPDADVVGFSLGVRYGDLIGHRGLSHSIPFAACLATAAALLWSPLLREPTRSLQAPIRLEPDPANEATARWWFLFACTASHGVLDAATDGGLGVAFLSPFSNERYFWSWRPIRVSPIGLTRFLSGRGIEVITTELAWIWLPCAIVLAGAYTIHRRAR